MTGYGVLALTLLIGGLGPVLVIGSMAGVFDRLVALELGASLGVLFMLVFTEVSGQSYELVLPLVLAPLSLVGTLVFTRLLRGGER